MEIFHNYWKKTSVKVFIIRGFVLGTAVFLSGDIATSRSDFVGDVFKVITLVLCSVSMIHAFAFLAKYFDYQNSDKGDSGTFFNN